MKKINSLILSALLLQVSAMGQIVLPVPVQNECPKDAQETVTVRDGQKIISGVSEPSIEVYLPSADKNVGTAVILCPGGAMRFLSWTNDVERMAKLLNERGVAAIGLKYRLNNSTTPPAASQSKAKKKNKKLDAGTAAAGMPFKTYDVTEFQQFANANANPMPSVEGDAANMRAVEDCRAAVKLVREHAGEWNIDPAKVGVLGFSAGGGVATGATITAQEGEMPDFLVTVYGPSLMDVVVPENAPDLLIMTRAEHPNVAAGCLGLFLEWKKAGKNAELHMYGDGVGPFGMADRRSANTTDSWPDELLNWMAARKLIVNTANFLQVEDGGTGPYKAVIDRSDEAPDYTIYRPANLDYAVKQCGPLPLLLFANGGCSFSSEYFEKFLTEIASHGYIVAAVGSFKELSSSEIQSLGMTDTEYMVHAMDVMESLNADPSSLFYNKVDMKHIAASGQSCGGGQALSGSVDPRITTTIALNSGYVGHKPPFPVEEPGSKRPAEGPAAGFAKSVTEGGLYGKEFGGTATQADLVKLHAPVLYLIGGPDDVAFEPSAQNFAKIDHVPVALCNLPVGHMATYAQPHGGAFAEITLKWLDWQLKGLAEASQFFLDDTYRSSNYPDWTVDRKGF